METFWRKVIWSMIVNKMQYCTITLKLGKCLAQKLHRFWVCWLSSTWIVLNNWSLSTSVDLPDQELLSSKKSPTWNFAKHFSHVWSVIAPSPNTTQILFVLQLRFYLSWNNKASHGKKVAFSSIFNIQIATQKFTFCQ